MEDVSMNSRSECELWNLSVHDGGTLFKTRVEEFFGAPAGPVLDLVLQIIIMVS